MAGTQQGIKLIVGLGNPGPDYATTRHNAGVWFVSKLCEHYQLQTRTETKFHGSFAVGSAGGEEFKVLIPHTYMNLSGRSVGAFVKYYQIPVENILVAHDELDIAVGDIRFKTGGGHGGHNGLRDIIHHLNTKEFHRLRIGIGHPGQKAEVAHYVLQRPSKAEALKIENGITAALNTVPEMLTGHFHAVMQQLHSL